MLWSKHISFDYKYIFSFSGLVTISSRALHKESKSGLPRLGLSETGGGSDVDVAVGV